MEVGVGARDLHRLVPDHRMRAFHGRPVEFHEARLALCVHEAERVHAEALHHAQAARNGAIGHHPHQHVRRLGHQRHEVPERVVRRSGLRHGVMRLGLDRMDQVRKLHRVLDEEHGDVVTDEVPVAFVGVELDGEPTHVAREVRGPALARHGGEAHEYRRAFACLGEHRCARELGQRLVAFEVTMRAGTTRVHDALGNALVIEVRDLLAQDEIFQQRRAAQSGFQGILVVRDRHALVGGEHAIRGIGAHTVERHVGGVQPDRRRTRTHLGRGIHIGESAARGGRVARRVMRADAGRACGITILAGLGGILRHGRGQFFGRRHLACGDVPGIRTRRFARGTADRRARR